MTVRENNEKYCLFGLITNDQIDLNYISICYLIFVLVVRVSLPLTVMEIPVNGKNIPSDNVNNNSNKKDAEMVMLLEK